MEFKDRQTGLIVFGILEILLGCLCALLVPLMIWGQAMSAQATGGAPNFRMAIPGALVYAMLAVALVWLGIGSMRFRRWARALLLILSRGGPRAVVSHHLIQDRTLETRGAGARRRSSRFCESTDERLPRCRRGRSSPRCQAACFEIVTTAVGHLPVPEWVFREFELPVEQRNFRYEAMLYLALCACGLGVFEFCLC